jgi:hypothetical protein
MARTTELAAWLKVVAKVEKAKRVLGCDNDNCWFRGQSNSNWGLMPGLFRMFADRRQRPNAKKMRQRVWELESDLYWEATTRSPDLQDPGMSGWDVLFLMQHHGFPTRLLDWTEVLSVAAYFAISKYDSFSSKAGQPTPAIWVLNPYTLNDEAWGIADLIDPRNLGWDEGEKDYYDYRDYMTELYNHDYSDLPAAIYPAQKSYRMRAQSGRFTIHGRMVGGLEELCPKAVRKVVIPHDAISDLNQFLEYSGVFEHVLFPDLDGMARSLRTRYGFGNKAR